MKKLMYNKDTPPQKKQKAITEIRNMKMIKEQQIYNTEIDVTFLPITIYCKHIKSNLAKKRKRNNGEKKKHEIYICCTQGKC